MVKKKTKNQHIFPIVFYLLPVVRRQRQIICKCYIDTSLVKKHIGLLHNFNNVYRWFKFLSSTQNVSNEEAFHSLLLASHPTVHTYSLRSTNKKEILLQEIITYPGSLSNSYPFLSHLTEICIKSRNEDRQKLRMKMWEPKTSNISEAGKPSSVPSWCHIMGSLQAEQEQVQA